MFDGAGHDYAAICIALTQNLLNLITQRATADQEKTNALVGREHYDSSGQFHDTVPGAESTDKAHQDFVWGDSQFFAGIHATDARFETIDIDCVWVHHDLLLFNTSAQ